VGPAIRPGSPASVLAPSRAARQSSTLSWRSRIFIPPPAGASVRRPRAAVKLGLGLGLGLGHGLGLSVVASGGAKRVSGELAGFYLITCRITSIKNNYIENSQLP